MTKLTAITPAEVQRLIMAFKDREIIIMNGAKYLVRGYDLNCGLICLEHPLHGTMLRVKAHDTSHTFDLEEYSREA